MKKSFLFVIVFIFCSGSAFSQVYTYVNGNGRTVYSMSSSGSNEYSGGNRSTSRYKFSQSKEKTAEDIPLDFTPEKTDYKYGKLRIWGNVKNKLNGKPYESVKVTFSLWGGRGGTLMAREFTYTSPTEIGPGKIGYILDFGIKCDISELNLIEYQVTGR